MAVLNGSSRGDLFPRRNLWALTAWLFSCAWTAATGAPGPLPDYAREAFSRFNTNLPKGWAYTLTTRRNDQEMVERFDPSRGTPSPWTLLRLDGRAPDAGELEKYARSRPDAGAGGPQPIFQKEDVEPGSLELVREGPDRAEIRGVFRSVASNGDPTLGHLAIRLFVHKQPAYVERYRLELKEPYSPVLGVKTKALTVEASFLAPTADQPSLPGSLTSDFAGTLLLIPKQEKLEVRFSEFVRSP
jgi:hypothetical protein